MKPTTLAKILATGVACAMGLATVLAQDSTTTTTVDPAGTTTTSTTTMNGTGTISTIAPDSNYVVFSGESSAEPVRYYRTTKTVVVDPEGHTVAWSALRPDIPVRYTYVREGDRMVITKVTLERPISYYEKSTTTTTTTRP
jgi:hypothetical protein